MSPYRHTLALLLVGCMYVCYNYQDTLICQSESGIYASLVTLTVNNLPG